MIYFLLQKFCNSFLCSFEYHIANHVCLYSYNVCIIPDTAINDTIGKNLDLINWIFELIFSIIPTECS